MAAADRGRELAERLRAGKLVLLVDNATEPAEAVLACAAVRVTPAAVNFMATHGRGLVCLGLTRERMRRLGIPLMATEHAAHLPADADPARIRWQPGPRRAAGGGERSGAARRPRLRGRAL